MSDTSTPAEPKPVSVPAEPVAVPAARDEGTTKEQAAPDPTRYGDWEKNGRCIDF